MISIRGVTVDFGAVKAVDDVSLEIPRNEVRGLLGPNGAGKTTLVKVIATLLRPNAGTAVVGGHDIAADPNAVRSMIGLAGQYAAVDDLLTGRENLEIVGALYQLPKAEAKRRADEALERLSLTDAADRLVRTYSGGMRRRLDLGASLVGRPEVLILDEPTTGLDPRTRLDLWAFLRDLVSEGATVLLTTQYLEEADELADQITVIDHGRIIADGTADELKGRVGGDLVTATPKRRADLDRVRDLLATIGTGTVRVDETELHVSVPVDQRVEALVKAAQAIDQAGIELLDLGVQRPSLDDVFLAITGHAAEELTPNGDKPRKRRARR
ncbi:MAG: ATP-binding cassette domain-containing protein [Acidimicrobiales bacterium]|nr:ATP-binding cassette domain-containing protein [Acidimicrobiales bacterium]